MTLIIMTIVIMTLIIMTIVIMTLIGLNHNVSPLFNYRSGHRLEPVSLTLFLW